ncbi:MAG: hypothetical protein ACFFBY_02935, partial [Promethearchaeota archaeon]
MKEKFNKLLFSFYRRKQIVMFITSSLALLFVFFQVNFHLQNDVLGFLFGIILLTSTAIIILFLPFYPLYYIILKEK